MCDAITAGKYSHTIRAGEKKAGCLAKEICDSLVARGVAAQLYFCPFEPGELRADTWTYRSSSSGDGQSRPPASPQYPWLAQADVRPARSPADVYTTEPDPSQLGVGGHCRREQCHCFPVHASSYEKSTGTTSSRLRLCSRWTGACISAAAGTECSRMHRSRLYDKFLTSPFQVVDLLMWCYGAFCKTPLDAGQSTQREPATISTMISSPTSTYPLFRCRPARARRYPSDYERDGSSQ